VLTAADVVAVGLPLIAYGTSTRSVLGYCPAVLVIVLARRFAYPHRWLAQDRALREGQDDPGQSEVAPSRALPAVVLSAPIVSGR